MFQRCPNTQKHFEDLGSFTELKKNRPYTQKLFSANTVRRWYKGWLVVGGVCRLGKLCPEESLVWRDRD